MNFFNIQRFVKIIGIIRTYLLILNNFDNLILLTILNIILLNFVENIITLFLNLNIIFTFLNFLFSHRFWIRSLNNIIYLRIIIKNCWLNLFTLKDLLLIHYFLWLNRVFRRQLRLWVLQILRNHVFIILIYRIVETSILEKINFIKLMIKFLFEKLFH